MHFSDYQIPTDTRVNKDTPGMRDFQVLDLMFRSLKFQRWKFDVSDFEVQCLKFRSSKFQTFKVADFEV